MKSGFVAILGRPNVGKSTLLNHILKKKISIVTDKSQTTRNNIRGIYSSDEGQIVFLDTPGVHKPHQKLGEEMNVMAYSAAHDADVSILVVDTSKEFGKGDMFLIEHVDIHKTPLIIAFNKIDLITIDKAETLKRIYREHFPNAIFIDTVAKEGFNTDEIIKTIFELLPEGEPFYNDEDSAEHDLVFQIKEIIREKALLDLREEVPHSIAVYIQNIEWESNPINIFADIIVEKDGQKGIVLGTNGKRIKHIGTRARYDIEKLLKKHVFLDLHVKVEADWRNQDKSLSTFGYKNKK